MTKVRENYATLHLEKPLVSEKVIFQIPAGENLQKILEQVEICPGFAFVVMINGLVSESNIIVNAGDEIHCLPQITGGML